jgi:hypothetical protein
VLLLLLLLWWHLEIVHRALPALSRLHNSATN